MRSFKAEGDNEKVQDRKVQGMLEKLKVTYI
jgi:hypothetical protein